VIVEPDVEPVSEESVVEEPVREEERDDNDDQVEELAENEAKVVNVVLVVNIFGEKLEKEIMTTNIRQESNNNFRLCHFRSENPF
jgi:hypothetical protein